MSDGDQAGAGGYFGPRANAVGVDSIGVSTMGNTAGLTGLTKGDIVFVGSQAVTLSQSRNSAGATISINVAPEVGIALSAGTQTAVTGTVVLSNSNGISFGMSGNSRVTASVAAVMAMGVSTGGNTAGTTGTQQGTVAFAGLGGVTLSQATAVGGATISISVAPDVAALGVSGGNTSGTTGTQQGTIALAGIGGITLSQVTAAGGASISISGPPPNPSISYFANPPFPLGAEAVLGNESRMTVQRFLLHSAIAATEFDFVLRLDGDPGTAVATVNQAVAIYTMSGSTASLASSASRSFSFTTGTALNSSVFGGQSGFRQKSISLGTWNLTPGDYLLGFNLSVDGVIGNAVYMAGGGITDTIFADGGGGNYHSKYFNHGAITASMPVTIAASQINNNSIFGWEQPAFTLVGTA